MIQSPTSIVSASSNPLCPPGEPAPHNLLHVHLAMARHLEVLANMIGIPVYLTVILILLELLILCPPHLPEVVLPR